MKKSSSKAGITLIAMIITIIVMLILAGVSLNAVIGENGILTQAISASEATKLAQIKEELEYMFLDYNINADESALTAYLGEKVSDGDIDEYSLIQTADGLKTIIIKDGYYFYVAEENGEYYATQMDTDLDSITTSTFVAVTQEAFDSSSGSMSFELDEGGESTVIFYEEIKGELNFDIVSGTVTIYVTQNMTLTNQDMERSAVDVHEGATLNLYISDGITMSVDSSYGGVSGSGTSADDIYGGSGAYAGIHVPEGATLNVYGEGTLIAYGGDAGDGGTCPVNSYDAGGGRRWPVPEQELAETGGKGGDTSHTIGDDGEDGEDAGNINIYNEVKVYAYGGGAGSGGDSTQTWGLGGGGGRPEDIQQLGIGRRSELVEELVIQQ